MIKKIDYIRAFGIYKNFVWNNPDLKDFNSKNLFYGWNYSGKTTLSRTFSSLRDKKLHESYPNASFRVVTDLDTYESSNLENFPYDILIFNSDYIKDNLNFSYHIDEITQSETIFFEVGDNAIYETKIIDLKNQIDLINGTDLIIGKKNKFKKDVEDFEIYDKSYSGKFTLFAKEIKDEHFISLINFTKSNLKPIVSDLKDDLDSHIIKDKKQLLLLADIVKISEPKEILNEIKISFISDIIGVKTNEILNAIPEKTVLIKILDDNPEAYNWVKKGREYNHANKNCLFCDNTVTEERITLLNEYFNNQASNLREKTTEIKQLILNEEDILKNINLPLSSNDFNLGYINEYKKHKNQLDKILISYRKYLKDVNNNLDNKINKSLYKKVKNIPRFDIQNLLNIINDINILIRNNNNFSSEFNSKIEIERVKFKNHLVASFLKREKYFQKEKKYTKAIQELEKLNKKIQEYETQISFNESKKVSDKEGAQQYNYFIQSFLDRSDIIIKIDEETRKFILVRENENASNLSEGEKTAIAFSHFLVTIKSLISKNKFLETIVFIDDPISSLDGNHIFQINSLLKEIFFSNKNPGNEWKLRCKQLFLSTHNFEFLNLLKELPLNKKESRYIIERAKNKNSSALKPLPEIFDKYSSEYHYLFKEIYEFNNLRKPLVSDKLLIIPNVLRRFLEMYTLTKYPSKENVDRRADFIFKPEISKRICKPFHYFSHLDNIDRIGKQSEFLADIPIACKTLINHIKLKDKMHFEALMEAVKL